MHRRSRGVGLEYRSRGVGLKQPTRKAKSWGITAIHCRTSPTDLTNISRQVVCAHAQDKAQLGTTLPRTRAASFQAPLHIPSSRQGWECYRHSSGLCWQGPAMSLTSPHLALAADLSLGVTRLHCQECQFWNGEKRAKKRSDTPILWAENPWLNLPHSINIASSKPASKAPRMHRICPPLLYTTHSPVMPFHTPLSLKAKVIKAPNFLDS